MKILITGMNKNQCVENFYLQQQLNVVPSHYSLIRCLRDMGHTVEQRLVKVGEDLSEYDKVICFLASPSQNIQLTYYNGLWAIYNTPKDRLILAYDDWQTKGIYSNICKSKDELLKDFTIRQSSLFDKTISKEMLKPFVDQLTEAIDVISKKNLPVLLSVFANGDMSKLIEYPTELIFGYNPNPYHRNRVPGDRGDLPLEELSFMETQVINSAKDDFVSNEDRLKCFNFASLVQSATSKWLKKQNISKWDIEYFGSRALKQRRLSEGDMCQVYAEQWGCLMPGYIHNGSGWWRARPLQVADGGSILIGDRDELFVLYNDEDLSSLTAVDIEKLSTQELSYIAQAQKDALYKTHPLDKSVQQAELSKALNI